MIYMQNVYCSYYRVPGPKVSNTYEKKKKSYKSRGLYFIYIYIYSYYFHILFHMCFIFISYFLIFLFFGFCVGSATYKEQTNSRTDKYFEDQIAKLSRGLQASDEQVSKRLEDLRLHVKGAYSSRR